MRVGLTLAIVAVAVLAFTRTIAVALAVPDQAIISQVHKVLERVFFYTFQKIFLKKQQHIIVKRTRTPTDKLSNQSYPPWPWPYPQLR